VKRPVFIRKGPENLNFKLLETSLDAFSGGFSFIWVRIYCAALLFVILKKARILRGAFGLSTLFYF
jgi:hypothetical protein